LNVLSVSGDNMTLPATQMGPWGQNTHGGVVTGLPD